MATLGANCGSPNFWCAQMDPGGLPSMGPLSPGSTPGSAGSHSCWVVFASAVGAGSSVATAFRYRRSNRGIGVVNGCTPNSGLGGAPVGTWPYALLAYGLRPLVRTRVPAAVKRPLRTSDPREPC